MHAIILTLTDHMTTNFVGNDFAQTEEKAMQINDLENEERRTGTAN